MTKRKAKEWRVFAKRLKEVREKTGLSQRGLGLAIGLEVFAASPRINRYEQGMFPRDMRDAERIAAELGVPLSMLFEQDDTISKLIELIGDMDKKERSELLKRLATDGEI